MAISLNFIASIPPLILTPVMTFVRVLKSHSFLQFCSTQCPRLNSICSLKQFSFFGQVCGLAKMYQISFHAAFRIFALVKYEMSGVRLSRAVLGRSEL